MNSEILWSVKMKQEEREGNLVCKITNPTCIHFGAWYSSCCSLFSSLLPVKYCNFFFFFSICITAVMILADALMGCFQGKMTFSCWRPSMHIIRWTLLFFQEKPKENKSFLVYQAVSYISFKFCLCTSCYECFISNEKEKGR